MTADGEARVLYVVGEESDTGRSWVRLASQRERFEVVVEPSIADGLDVLGVDDVDCVVAEHRLADGDGFQLLSAVREEAPDLPFVLFPLDGDEELASRAISAGVDDYVRRDDGYDVLADRVEAAVAAAGTAASADAGTGAGADADATDGARAGAADGTGAGAADGTGAGAVVDGKDRAAGADPPAAGDGLAGSDRPSAGERLRLFVERAPLAVVEWNRDFEVVGWNEAAEELFGYDEREALGRHASFLVPEDERERVEADAERLLSDWGGDHDVAENVAKGGERVRCEWHNRIVTDDAGEVAAVFSLVQDVTERRERQQVMRTLHDATREMVAADTRREIAEVALEAAVEVLGLTQTGVHLYDETSAALEPVAWTGPVEEHVGEPPPLGRESLAWSAFANGTAARFDDLADAEGTHNPDTPYRSEILVPLGEHGVALFSSTEPEVFDEDDQRFAELLCANATAAMDRASRESELRERERELERENDRLDEFTRVVSHDLRNPLNLASGELELAAGECDSEHLSTAAEALERMEQLIADLLTMAREGRAVDEVEPVSLATVARTAWEGLGATDATLDAEGDPRVLADRERLLQLLENLFRNAIEHGGDDVTVEIGPVGGADGPDGFYVADDGVGIPEPERETVFEAGFTTSEDGTGFGLNIVEDIAEAHGWRVDVGDAAAGGARFEVTGVDVE